MADSGNASGTNAHHAARRVTGRASWILVATCLVSLVVYLALHARELRLIREWLAPG